MFQLLMFFLFTACEIIKAIEMPNLKLQFDIYHAQRMDGNITDFLKGHIDLIGMIIWHTS